MKIGKWWPNYSMQETIIFDEFYGWLELDEFLRLIDWNPHKAEYKGGYVPVRAHRFVFTSNVDPRDLYLKYAWVRRQAYFRRLVEFGKIYKWTKHDHTDGLTGEFVDDTESLKEYKAIYDNNPSLHDDTVMTKPLQNKPPHSY